MLFLAGCGSSEEETEGLQSVFVLRSHSSLTFHTYPSSTSLLWLIRVSCLWAMTCMAGRSGTPLLSSLCLLGGSGSQEPFMSWQKDDTGKIKAVWPFLLTNSVLTFAAAGPQTVRHTFTGLMDSHKAAFMYGQLSKQVIFVIFLAWTFYFSSWWRLSLANHCCAQCQRLSKMTQKEKTFAAGLPTWVQFTHSKMKRTDSHACVLWQVCMYVHTENTM